MKDQYSNMAFGMAIGVGVGAAVGTLWMTFRWASPWVLRSAPPSERGDASDGSAGGLYAFVFRSE